MHRSKQQSWIFALCLSISLHTMAVLAQSDGAGDGASVSEAKDLDSVDVAVDEAALEYLQYISDVIDESPTDQWQGRWQDGQLNILPDSMMGEGFADTVHCFKPEDQPGAATSGKMTLHFDLSSMEPSVQYVAVQLVFKLSIQHHDYTVKLYSGYGDSGKALDSHTISTTTQGWMVLSAHNPDPDPWTPPSKDDYTLTLEVTSSQGEPLLGEIINAFYGSVLPRLVIYTSDNQTMNIDFTSIPETDGNPTTKRSSAAHFDALYPGGCKVRSWTTSWDALGWPGKSYRVLVPSEDPVMTFCYGHCNSPLGNPNQYTAHARVIESLNIFGNGNLPSPGCVPQTLSPITVMYTHKSYPFHLESKPFLVVSKCLCR